MNRASAASQREDIRRARVLFWIAFLSASAFSVLTSRLATWVPATVAGGIMLLYLGASLRLTPHAVEHDDFPDGFYYLGFLLTLVALVVALFRVDPDDPGVLKAVLGQFGLALTTTILGLAVRTWLNMFHDEIHSSPDDEAESYLRKAADDLRFVLIETATNTRTASGELSAAVEDLRVVLQQAGADMATTVRSAGGEIGAVVGDVSQSLAGLALQVHETEGHFEPVGKHLSSASESAAQFGQALNTVQSSVAGLSEPLGGLSASTTQLRTTMSSTEDQLRALLGTVAATADAYKELNTTLESISASQVHLRRFIETVASLQRAPEGAAAFVSSLSSSSDRLADFAQALSTAAQSMRPIHELPDWMGGQQLEVTAKALRTNLESMQESLGAWRRTAAAMDELSRQLQERQVSAAQALLGVNDDLVAGVRFLRNTLTDAARAQTD